MNTETPAPLPPPLQAPPLEPPLPETLDCRTLLDSLLRQPQVLVQRLATGHHRATPCFLGVAILSFLFYGVVLGCFAKHEQLWAAPLKVTVGMLIAGLICFPSLYIFSTLAGARVHLGQLAACLSGALALAGLLLLGFAPALWIFAESTHGLGFMGALGIGTWVIALLFALRFLRAAVRAAGGVQWGPMAIWSLVFLLVSLQMTTTLRPILGRSETWLTHEKKFFLEHWNDTRDRDLP